MPIILTYSHSHAFAYTDEQGTTHEVKVTKGEDIEPYNIPQAKLSSLLSEMVVGPEGSTRFPRYTYVSAHEADEDPKPRYNEGTITKQKFEAATKPPKHTDEEIQAMLAQAAEEEAVKNARDEIEESELAQVALEQAERASQESEARANARAQAAAAAAKAVADKNVTRASEEEPEVKTRAQKAAETRAANKAKAEASDSSELLDDLL